MQIVPTTIRDHIKSISKEIGSEELLPERAAELLVSAASLFGNVLEEIRKRESDYNKVLLIAYDTEQVANRARIKAVNDPSYLLLREAQDAKVLTLEIIRALKYYLKAKSDEYQVSKYQ